MNQSPDDTHGQLTATDSERQIIAVILEGHSEYLPIFVRLLSKPEMFTDKDCCLVWRFVLESAQNGEPVNLDILAAKIRRSKIVPDANALLLPLVETHAILNERLAEWHTQQVACAFARRQWAGTSALIVGADKSPQELAAALRETLDTIQGIVEVTSEGSREPLPLPSSISPIPAFDVDRLLPHSLRAYVRDCAERLQVDASFVAVPLLVSLGAVMGNRLGLRPKQNDDWTEFPNLWGAVIGRPATLKSPAMSAALRFVGKLEAAANEEHKQAIVEWKQEAAAADVRRAAARANATKAAKNGRSFDPSELVAGDAEDGPACRRFITNDATPEALHVLLSREVNASGVMVFADELSGLLSRLNDAERGGALRAFMLSAWSGHQSAVVDRVGRGENLRVDRCCVSVLGGIQPGKIAPLVDGAVKESIEDDGWLQRLSLLVWPDAPADFKVVDRLPDSAAFAEVMSIFDRAESTEGEGWPGAEWDAQRGEWFLRFEPSAAEDFKEWLEHETKTLRSDDIGAALESHFIKYRKAVCGLALLFHIATEPDNKAVSQNSLVRALEWVDYLKAHARRVYGSGRNATASTAGRILQRIERGDLPPRFRARDVKRPGWSGLTDGEAVDSGLAMLEEYGWLDSEEVKPAMGRRTRVYVAHPHLSELIKRPTVETAKSSSVSFGSVVPAT